jgi:hypothetical protein
MNLECGEYFEKGGGLSAGAKALCLVTPNGATEAAPLQRIVMRWEVSPAKGYEDEM